ncbi:MAG: hypothetical protein IPF64_12445 [Flavobacteriales bacterium]|nr:hypothetical protein [Flavobacteriales bacterium]
MNTMTKVGALALAIAATGLVNAYGQVSVATNNPPGGSFLGHIGSNPNAVEVRHNGNQPIEWFTDSLIRMRLYEDRTQTINNFPVRQEGYLGISNIEAFNLGGNGAFSRLHLADSSSGFISGYAPVNGFRGWMRNGVNFTGNADQGYVGQKYGALDRSDMILQWSNDPGMCQFSPDYLRFIFTSSYDTTMTTGARSVEGLEAMRFLPLTDSTLNVGIGDFFAAADDPTEHLDVLDGRVGFGSYQPNPQWISPTNSWWWNSDGVLGWRNLPAGTGGVDCDWDILTGSRVLRSGSAAPNPTSSCPDRGWLYSVGTQNYGYKMQIFHDDLDRNVPGGLQVDYKGDDGGPYSYGYAMLAECPHRQEHLVREP